MLFQMFVYFQAILCLFDPNFSGLNGYVPHPDVRNSLPNQMNVLLTIKIMLFYTLVSKWSFVLEFKAACQGRSNSENEMCDQCSHFRFIFYWTGTWCILWYGSSQKKLGWWQGFQFQSNSTRCAWSRNSGVCKWYTRMIIFIYLYIYAKNLTSSLFSLDLFSVRVQSDAERMKHFNKYINKKCNNLRRGALKSKV